MFWSSPWSYGLCLEVTLVISIHYFQNTGLNWLLPLNYLFFCSLHHVKSRSHTQFVLWNHQSNTAQKILNFISVIFSCCLFRFWPTKLDVKHSITSLYPLKSFWNSWILFWRFFFQIHNRIFYKYFLLYYIYSY